ncbi:hypothetical protein PAXRUDRAFT_355459 [Paxillus rubicundulus Ve08.2h10]|uniref:Uncharacterized protein n=1 Tax=Paxillus rubicundulus Ve08.2h10 TaxID=930991 RepID=A0A0D0DRN2_9AGAM|nr:hypothetical protein PAXRUDRAFT_355459 [Paxillus rubicundulus Ve08.2h10]
MLQNGLSLSKRSLFPLAELVLKGLSAQRSSERPLLALRIRRIRHKRPCNPAVRWHARTTARIPSPPINLKGSSPGADLYISGISWSSCGLASLAHLPAPPPEVSLDLRASSLLHDQNPATCPRFQYLLTHCELLVMNSRISRDQVLSTCQLRLAR